MSDLKVIFLMGPTASGKSALAMNLARSFQVEIVNADSIQLYSKLRIGSAFPSPQDMLEVPHHLYGVVEPPEKWSAGQYRTRALSLLQSLGEKKKSKVLIFVGGSGFYFQALEKGMFPSFQVLPEVEKQLRKKIQEEGSEVLLKDLRKIDSEYADKISASDPYRILRALGVWQSLGKTPSQIRREFAEKAKDNFPYPLLKIGLSLTRYQLAQRVLARTEAMIREGLLDEVRGLLDEGLHDWHPLSSVGYKECALYFTDPSGKDQSWLQGEIVRNTMSLAKRQRTWFQRDLSVFWQPVDADLGDLLTRVEQFID